MGMGTQHTWPRGNRQEMHGHLAGSLNSQECNVARGEDHNVVCVRLDNKISRVFSAVRSFGHCLLLYLQSADKEHCIAALCHIALL